MIILKVTKKAKFHPLFRRCICGKTTGRVKLNPPAISGLKHHLFIYADLECLIENIDRCKKKLEN